MLPSEKVPTEQEFYSTVDRILQHSEYRSLRNLFSDLFEKAKDFIGKLIGNILKKTFSNLQNASKISDNISEIFIIIALLILVCIIIVIIVKVSKTFERRKKIKEILGEKIDEGTTPKSLRAKASAFEKDGDFRQAIRYGFISILLLMHNKSLLYLDETETNDEIYTYLKNNKFSGLEKMKYVMDFFNSSWYGHKSCSAENYLKWYERLNLLWGEVIEHEIKNK